MVINGWRYAFDTLPHWQIRTQFPYVSDSLYENPQLDLAFLIYSATEYRMGCSSGFLAVLGNKKSPELLFQAENCTFNDSWLVFSKGGKLAFAQSGSWAGGWPIFVFDMSNERFACFNTTTDNKGFSVKKIERNSFVIAADEWQMKHNPSGLLKNLNGSKIDPEALTWMPLNQMDVFCHELAKSGQA